ncbi:MAG TPA: hypothetical protein ENH82_05085 [bacterium]|nr:hypothetical protein [bacterium]
MPVEVCNGNGLPGFKFGESGKCFTYRPGNVAGRNAAREKANRQGQAIKISQTNNREAANG